MLQNNSIGATTSTVADTPDFNVAIDRRDTHATKFDELLEKYGRIDLLPLWIADMDFPSPEPVHEALARCVAVPVLGYTTAPAQFWDSIAGWLRSRHGLNVSRADIDFVPGVKKAIGLCVNYFTRTGDKVLIQPPVYHSFHSVVEGNGRVVVNNPLHYDGRAYSMDFNALEQTIAAERPRMMIVCNPHNPVGIQWSVDDLRRVVHICHTHGVTLLSDEIYADLTLNGCPHVPTASVSAEAAEITVTLGAPSKSFNIPGIASAWAMVLNPNVREPFFAWLRASEFDTPPICAIYATIAAYTRCEDWLNRALEYIHANCVFACRFIEERMPGVRAVMPQAGFGLWIDFRGTGISHDELCRLLVDEARVAVSDGATFGAEGSGFVRLNVGVARSVLAEGLESIAKALRLLYARP